MGTFQKGWVLRALISVIRSLERAEATVWARNIHLGELLIQGESKRAHEQLCEGYFETSAIRARPMCQGRRG
jgi:hypothetical protein